MEAIIFITLGILAVGGIALLPFWKSIQKDKKNPPQYDKSKLKK